MSLSPTVIDLDIHDPGSELLRIPFPRTPVNRGHRGRVEGRLDRATPTAFLEKGEPFQVRSPKHSVTTKGLGPCASQPGDHSL
jgi:hypothetical protein